MLRPPPYQMYPVDHCSRVWSRPVGSRGPTIETGFLCLTGEDAKILADNPVSGLHTNQWAYAWESAVPDRLGYT